MATSGTLQRMSAKTLSEKIKAEEQLSETTVAIVDVRDDDHIGGHIKTSLHFPSRQLDAQLPTLCRKLKDQKTVVFHCMLSQERGPKAALRYLRERDAVLEELGEKSPGQKAGSQEVYVLDRGFTGWQEVFGEDEGLTEGYRKELWEDQSGMEEWMMSDRQRAAKKG